MSPYSRIGSFVLEASRMRSPGKNNVLEASRKRSLGKNTDLEDGGRRTTPSSPHSSTRGGTLKKQSFPLVFQYSGHSRSTRDSPRAQNPSEPSFPEPRSSLHAVGPGPQRITLKPR